VTTTSFDADVEEMLNNHASTAPAFSADIQLADAEFPLLINDQTNFAAPYTDDAFPAMNLMDFQGHPAATNATAQPSIWDSQPAIQPGGADIFGFSLQPYASPASTSTGQPMSFPDDSLLPMTQLKGITAGLNVAAALNCSDIIWDLSYSHVLSPSTLPANLPPSLMPTPAQQAIPHHPFIDILPWPSVRSKLCIIFSQPVQLRPPRARDPDAITHMALDLDDEAEGVKVNGSDEFDARNWEVGELFFRNWWWAFDREIVDNSNRFRAQRGLGQLRITAAE
jgi:Domain of unknown function (DUF3425)